MLISYQNLKRILRYLNPFLVPAIAKEEDEKYLSDNSIKDKIVEIYKIK